VVRTVVNDEPFCFQTTLVRLSTVKSGKNPLASAEIVVVVTFPTTRVRLNGVVNVVSANAYKLPVADRATVGGVVLKFRAETLEKV
jgi:hypothetical protein